MVHSVSAFVSVVCWTEGQWVGSMLANVLEVCQRCISSVLADESVTHCLDQVLYLTPNCSSSTVEALISGHPRDAEKVSISGAGRLPEWFS